MFSHIVEFIDSLSQAVQPKPAPCSTKVDKINKKKAGGFNQKLILFSLGKATSGAPIIIGTNQFSIKTFHNVNRTIFSTYMNTYTYTYIYTYTSVRRIVSEEFI